MSARSPCARTPSNSCAQTGSRFEPTRRNTWTPVLKRVLATLQAAPRSTAPWDLEGPRSYTYIDLARMVYGLDETDEPTAAQTVSVKRAVGVLVARGQATRRRVKGTRVTRALTEAEQEARDALVAENRRRFRGLGARGI